MDLPWLKLRFTDAVIVGNGLAMVIRLLEPAGNRFDSAHKFAASWDALFFGGGKLILKIKLCRWIE